MSFTQKDIYLGSDPEFFLVNKDEIFPAFFCLGDNEDPYKTKDGLNSMYHDNILVEYTTTPSNTLVSWLHNQKSVIKEVQLFLKKRHGNTVKLIYNVAAEVPDAYMEDDRCHTFGCNPVYNAYEEEVKLKKLNNPLKERFAGGHVHISYPGENIEVTKDLIKKLDLHLGLPSLLIEPFNVRRKYYGKAGSFRRVPNSRFEYRVLSNFWLAHDNYMTWVYKTINKIVLNTINGKMKPIDDELANKVRHAINSGNTKLAIEICNQQNIKILKNEKNIRLWKPNEGHVKQQSNGGLQASRRGNNKAKIRPKGWRDSLFKED